MTKLPRRVGDSMVDEVWVIGITPNHIECCISRRMAASTSRKYQSSGDKYEAAEDIKKAPHLSLIVARTVKFRRVSASFFI
jgi:hypothetical protein